MEIEIERNLLSVSKYAGMREDLVQAGGGNSSVKLTETIMVIKASGVQLADISHTQGFSVVDYSKIKKFMDDLVERKNEKTADQVLQDSLVEGARPSIETFLHAITGRVTLHTHPVAANVLTSRKNGMEKLKDLFPHAVFVEYATPGADLASLYYSAYKKVIKTENVWSKNPIIFLKNHGMVVSGDTAEDVIETTERVCRIIENETGLNSQPYRDAYGIYKAFLELDSNNDKIVVKVENHVVLDAYQKFGYKLWDYQFCPDCIVFCGKKHFVYSTGCGKELQEHIKHYGEPILIQYGNQLYIRAESVRKAREIESVLAFSAQVAMINQGYSIDLLTEEEQNFLLGWDAEKYRQSMK